nr:MAG: alpha/beta hydrolase [Hyphomicrobiales bacterium]
MSGRFQAQGLQSPDCLGLLAGKWDVADGVTPRAVCVLLQGFSEFLEKYHEVAAELNARGLIVVSVDWRSQGASERGARDNRTGHVADFEEYDLDLAVLFQKLAAPMNLPVIVIAHSMGAHILLRDLHENKRRYLCAALVAPMLDIQVEKYPRWLVRILTVVLNLRRASKRPLPDTAERDPRTISFEDNHVTSDPGRYKATQDKLKKQPFLRINGPSFGWLGAAFRSMRKIGNKNFAEEITTPLIVFGAGKDQVVKTEAIRTYVRWLAHAEYVEIDDSQHEILMEKNVVRARFWKAFDTFLELQLSKNPSGFFAARGSNQS